MVLVGTFETSVLSNASLLTFVASGFFFRKSGWLSLLLGPHRVSGVVHLHSFAGNAVGHQVRQDHEFQHRDDPRSEGFGTMSTWKGDPMSTWRRDSGWESPSKTYSSSRYSP